MINHKEILDGFLGVRNTKTHFQFTEPKLSERAVFIIGQLIKMGIGAGDFELLPFFIRGMHFYNIVVPVITGKDSDTIFLTAHHDVININSQNVNDNTASIVNLLVLMQMLKENEKDINHNIIICYPDVEEYGGEGAKIIAQRINNGNYGNVKCVLNLELTAHGKNIWIERGRNSYLRNELKNFLGKENYEETNIPFADSFVFQWAGIDSATIGTLPVNPITNKYDYSVWNICHKDNDDTYNLEDMQNFTNFLYNFLLSLKN